MTRRRSLAIAFALLAGGGLHGRQADDVPAFEVTSVRENRSVNEAGRMSGPEPGRFTAVNMPLWFILHDAFQIRAHQLIGLPDWAAEARHDITATYPAGFTPTQAQLRLMLQRLLADRFGLVVHREQRELPMYALVLARRDGALGPQLTRSDVDCQRWLAEKRPQIGAGGPSPVAPGGARPACMMIASRTMLSGGTQTIQQLTARLEALAGRAVVDRTGLTGTFNIDLKWDVAGNLGVTGAAAQGDGASMFTALEEQLGLKLEPIRAPAEVIVIDALERPMPD
jgi:uncharacterized protein (TIGR03435 family)